MTPEWTDADPTTSTPANIVTPSDQTEAMAIMLIRKSIGFRCSPNAFNGNGLFDFEEQDVAQAKAAFDEWMESRKPAQLGPNDMPAPFIRGMEQQQGLRDVPRTGRPG
jgi:hypothetical protein